MMVLLSIYKTPVINISFGYDSPRLAAFMKANSFFGNPGAYFMEFNISRVNGISRREPGRTRRDCKGGTATPSL